jgi:hypothetical protein
MVVMEEEIFGYQVVWGSYLTRGSTPPTRTHGYNERKLSENFFSKIPKTNKQTNKKPRMQVKYNFSEAQVWKKVCGREIKEV